MFELADREYVIRLQNGELTAFDALYWKYHRSIYLNILGLIKDRAAAEDLLQEVFIALWENRQVIDANQPVAGWLYAVSHNKSINYLKKTLRQSILNTEVAAELYPGDQDDDTDKNDKLQMLEEAIRQLSAQQQKVFELCKIQGYTYEETAVELHISRHTVKEYLSLAMAGIKEYLDNHFISFILPGLPFISLFLKK